MMELSKPRGAWGPSLSCDPSHQIANLEAFLLSEFDMRFGRGKDVVASAIGIIEALLDKREQRDYRGSALREFAIYANRPVPSVKGSDTSEAAAESMEKCAATLRSRALIIIANYPSTCDEIEVEMAGKHQTISPRIWELKNMGLIADSGVRRRTRSGRNAAVYKATKLGRDRAEKGK